MWGEEITKMTSILKNIESFKSNINYKSCLRNLDQDITDYPNQQKLEQLTVKHTLHESCQKIIHGLNSDRMGLLVESGLQTSKSISCFKN